MGLPERVQIQVDLSFKHEPRDHPGIRALLEQGYRIVDLQRLTDKEAAVTLAPGGPPPSPPA
jgi:hypothetical protein